METGYLAEYKNASDLANGIRVLLGSGDLRLRMRSNCRKVAKEEFSLGLQAQRYAELYGNLMEEIRFWNKQK
jgi:glycosyltransferase involved in cell wall biosynthesis